MKLLDCTIRDGGYYTGWDFDNDLVLSYLQNFENLPFDYLEVGYRSPALEGYYGEYFYCNIDTLNFLKDNSSKKLAIILDEKNVRINMLDELLDPCLGIVSLIRIAIDPTNFDRAINLAIEIKKKGFEIAFNLMYMSNWNEYPEMIKNFSKLNNLVDYLYLVDSYGGVFPNDVRDVIKRVRANTNVKIGFHGHNNLEMALANTLVAIEEGVDIVDSTILGMGRGAGNLKTELLLVSLAKNYGSDINFDSLSDITSKFQKLKDHYNWGTSLPYMVSGANSLPQKQVMDWVSNRSYSLNSITRALLKNDNNNYLTFNSKSKFEKVVIVGGGVSIDKHKNHIINYLNKDREGLALIHASSKNAKVFEGLKIEQFFCLVGNEGLRLEGVFDDLSKFQGKCILPPSPRVMGTYVPDSVRENTYELSEINFTELTNDSHTAIAIQTALLLGAQTIFLIGFDGYSGDNISERLQALFIENNNLFNSIPKDINCISLTPTKYKEVQHSSIYKMLN